MDYLLITDFQKFFVYKEFPLKLYIFFFVLLYFSFFKFLYTSDILCCYPSENSFHVSPFQNLTLWCFNSLNRVIIWLIWKRSPERDPKSEHLGEGIIFQFRQGGGRGADPGWHYDHYLIVRAFLTFFLLENQGIKQNTWLFQTFS